MHPHARAHLYSSRRHPLLTLAFVTLPFLVLLFFAQIAGNITADFFAQVIVSLGRIGIAYLISVVLAWVAAISFYRGRRSLIALPIFDVLQSFPAFAALPIAVHFMGPSTGVVIIFLIIAIIWPIFFSVISSLKLAKKDWEDAVAVARLQGRQYLTHFLLPVSIPGVITGSIIGMGEGWEALVATEIITNVRLGVGVFFHAFSQNPTVITFGILGLLVIIFGINKLLWLPLPEWSHHRMEE